MNNVLDSCKNIIRILLRNCVRIFFLFPLKKERILFTDCDGRKVSDNPKCIYDFLENKYADHFEYVWVYNGNKKDVCLSNTVKVVKEKSLKWIYYMATAKVIVNDWPPSYLIPPRKKQLYIETWHAGGAYKKIGNAFALKKDFEKKLSEVSVRTIKVFVSSSRKFTEGNIKNGYQYNGEILNSGMPRNDIFFNLQNVKKAANKVKQHYSLCGSVALYAPTFRGRAYEPDEINDIMDMERLKAALELRCGMKVSILVRRHYLDKHAYSFGENVIDVSDYPDMQELLCVADILITDYSSCIWDYALLGRPCLLYVPDIDHYNRERGFFTPPEQWPGIICKSMQELCQEIENLDDENCAAKAKRHLEFMSSYETGHATEIISNRIVDFVNGD